jgi:SAM-dependent methyltransferase
MLKNLPREPAAGSRLDDPATTQGRREIIRKKRFLKNVYQDWYARIVRSLPQSGGGVLEVGSGAGFLSELLPGLITSEIMFLPGVSLVLDACRLPFQRAALRAVVMTDVLHHIPQPRLFFREAARSVRPGGVIAMVEPWRTAWSQWVYQHLHHEAFDPGVARWEFPSTGPLSSANGALPWILFERDRATFEREFPEWSVEEIELIMPFRYLLSGGFSFGSFQPGFAYPLWTKLEAMLNPWNDSLAMFAYIRLRRV